MDRTEMESIERGVDYLDRVAEGTAPVSALMDYYAHLPDHRYIHVPTRELWPASSVDGCVQPWPKGSKGKEIRPSSFLDANRAVEQMTWAPGLPMLIHDKLVQAGGWVRYDGATVFNLYRPPEPASAKSSRDCEPWLKHIRTLYPDSIDHIVKYLAHSIQRPGEKVNHALVIGGLQGTGKDTILEPVKHAVGHWNWSDINPDQMIRRFNGWAKAVVVRVSEARDLGEMDRFAFYDHSKTYIAAPPDVIRVDEKNLREHYVQNVMRVIITTNHKTDGLYLPADDRRHYVAWSDVDRSQFSEGYWQQLWKWYQAGGMVAVANYLRTVDLSGFDPKAPPPRTEAFYAIVQANSVPEDSELADAIERSGSMEALTLEMLAANADAAGLRELAQMLRDRSQRRSIPHRMERAGYVPVRNPNAADGLWKMQGRRQVIYANKRLTLADQSRSAAALVSDGRSV